MKFQKLTIHNIASIEDAVIDFEAQPLGDSEVFLITGKTGAGKSTILDAICLALYASTPRLESTKMQGEVQDGDKSFKVDDPRQMMRQNTGEAFVILTFTGSNGVHYEATWSVSRARKKVTGNLQQKSWQLKNLDTNHILTKDKEIEAEIQNAVKLDFNQFCRTTLLAQGEFTRFLNSDDKDKAVILEKITGVDIYSKIGAKVFAITKDKEQEKNTAFNLIENTRSLSEDEIVAEKEQLEKLEALIKEMKDASDQIVVKRNWIIDHTELTQNAKEAKKSFEEAKKVTESDDFKQLDTLVKEWNATIEERGWLTNIQKAKDDIKKSEDKLNELAVTYAKLHGGELYAESVISNWKNKLEQQNKAIEADKDKATVYEHAQTIAGYLNSIHDGREAINKKNEDIINLNNNHKDKLEPALKEAQSKVNTASSEAVQMKGKVDKKEAEIKKLNLTELRTKHQQMVQLLNDIGTARERIMTLNKEIGRRDKVSKELKEKKAELQAMQEKSADMVMPLHDAEVKKETKKEDLEKQIYSVQEFASTLRARLTVGDICPICRQKIEAEIPHEDLSTLITELQKSYDTAEKEWKDLDDAKKKLDADIKALSKSYDNDKKNFDEDKSVDEANSLALEACKTCGIDAITDDILSILDNKEKETQSKKDSLDKDLQAGEDQEKELDKMRKGYEEMRSALDDLKALEQKAQQAVDTNKAGIEAAKGIINTKKTEVDEATKKVRELIPDLGWSYNWEDSPKDFADALLSSSKSYSDACRQREQIKSDLGKAEEGYNAITLGMKDILESMPAWSEIRPTEICKVDKLPSLIVDLSKTLASTLSQLSTSKKEECSNTILLNNFLSNSNSITRERLEELNKVPSSSILQQDEQLGKKRNDVTRTQAIYQAAEERCEEHQRKKPEMEEGDTLESLNERIQEFAKKIEDCGEKKGAISQELKSDEEIKKQLGDLQIEAKKKDDEYQKWSKLNQLIGDATGSKFRKIAQSYVLSSLVHSANGYMKTLTDRYTLKVKPGTFLISIEDAYQGYVSRAASTISGGESFLVSLSLALALSDIGQRLSVDTLFIDEGFGTLSGEPLQNAIDTLRSLHTKAGRHVGIISHVEELQEKIPVQIQVNQENNNSSSTITIVP